MTSNAKRAAVGAARRPAGGAEPRWLTPDEQAAWLSLAGILIRLPAALDAQLQRDAGMNTFEYFVLTGLSQAPGHTLRMTDLAAVASGSASRLSHVVKRLEQRGWVRRELDAQDARCTNAVLTDAGWDTVVASAPGHVETVRHLVIDALTGGQVRQLHEIGERILGRLAPGEPCTAYRPATPHTEPAPSHAGRATPHTEPAPSHAGRATPHKPATPHAEPATPETEPATHHTMSATRRAKPATRRAKPATARSTKEPAS